MNFSFSFIFILLIPLCVANSNTHIDVIDYPSENQIIFREEGTVANQLSFLHVKAEMDLKPLFADIQLLNNTLFTLIKKELAAGKKKFEAESINWTGENKLPPKVSENPSFKAAWIKNQKLHASTHTDSAFVLAEMTDRLQTIWKNFIDIIITLPQMEDDTLLSQNMFHKRFKRDLLRGNLGFQHWEVCHSSIEHRLSLCFVRSDISVSVFSLLMIIDRSSWFLG